MRAVDNSGVDELDGAIGAATRALLGAQRADGHWVFELEADATIPSEYVLLVHYLGEPANLELERKIGVDTPPPITHPEFFYGFICVAVAWQVLFLIVSRDPIRFRPMMIPAMLEKIGFPIAVLVLYLQNRVSPTIFIPASLDLVLLVLFIAAYRQTRDSSRS
jgi:hypothetical protein